MAKPQESNDLPDLENDQLMDDALQAGDDDSKVEIEVDTPVIDALGSEERLESLQAQLKEAEDRVLRNQAELENFRRRARREIEEERRFANQPLLMDLFPVMDNIDRAIGAASQTADGGGLLEGFQMVAQQLLDTLAKHHCVKIAAEGQPFDPALHEAISQQPSDEYSSGTVMLVTQEGYQLHDRVIRPVQVIVSTGPAEK